MFTKISPRWVPKFLSAVQKQKRVRRANAFLELCSGKETKITIDSIVTGDETIVLYYKPESKLESMEWRYTGEAPTKKGKVSKSTQKL
jgi:hypothetical protein